MSKLLLIESSTADCSVALSEGNKLTDIVTIDTPRAHASMLAPCIETVLKRNGIKIDEISAIAVSGGPGSYTGLRVGVSVAKGLCFGKNIPLISVDTLEILARMAMESLHDIHESKSIIIPMIDARRMEVYTADFDTEGHKLTETEARILDENSYANEFNEYDRLVFIGDGAEKFKTVLDESKLAKSVFISCCPSASGMVIPAFESFSKSEFADTAYFEPFYLKSFVAGVSKKTLL